VAEVEYRNITKRYPNGVFALTDFQLVVDDGEFVVLVGPSGCGKSTALRLLAGLDKPSSGEIYLGGTPVTKQGPGERDIAMVFQNYALYPHMSVYKNLAYGLRQRKTPRDEVRRRVREISEMLGIAELFDRKPAQLSGGQRQRVAMGRALVREPQAFLLDEPLSNLDAKLRGQVRAELKRLHHRLGITSVYVTHDQVEAMTLADRICVMKEGELQQLGTPQEVYEHPANVFVAGFIGSPAMNLLPATVADGQVQLGGHPVARPPEGQTNVVVGIRPEDLTVQPEGRSGIPVTVDFHEPLGSHVLVHALLGDASVHVVDEPAGIVVQAGPDVRPAPGQRLTLEVEPKHTYLFDATTGAALSNDGRAQVVAT
jgi:sn-glycerol 3-phosphate transport system ATP-binding protein